MRHRLWISLRVPQRRQLAQQQVHAVAHFGLGDAYHAAGAAVRQSIQQHRGDGVQADLQRQRRGATLARWDSVGPKARATKMAAHLNDLTGSWVSS
jgi:hypothetical protein